MSLDDPVHWPWGLGELLFFWQTTSAAAATLSALLLLGLAGMLVHRALPPARALRALLGAPLVAVASGEGGLVKVAGQAHPVQATAGSTPPKDVWHQGYRFASTSTGMGTRTFSVGAMLLRDATGECLVDPARALVFASRVDSDSSHFLDSWRIATDHRIRTGDPVFAVGVLGQARVREGTSGLPRCTLRPSGSGVLIYAGLPEAVVRRRLRLRLWPLAALATVPALVGVAGLRAHMLTYETDVEFLQVLLSRPGTTLADRLPEAFVAPEAPVNAPADPSATAPARR